MTSPIQVKQEAGVVLAAAASGLPDGQVRRINSQDLFRQMREIEIEHGGRIYRLRLTQLNKLILTA